MTYKQFKSRHYLRQKTLYIKDTPSTEEWPSYWPVIAWTLLACAVGFVVLICVVK